MKFIFQPSEENTGGAVAIIKSGGLKAPDVDAIITPHNWHGLKQGVLVVKAGPVLASSDIFQLKIIGTPGHGAWPHLTVDPIVVAAEVISNFQNIVSREIDPLKSAAITIGKIYGGTAVNIIPELSSLWKELFARWILMCVILSKPVLKRFLRAVTQAARAKYELSYDRIMPPVNNDIQLTAHIREIIDETLFEPDMIADDFMPSMGCEELLCSRRKFRVFFSLSEMIRKDAARYRYMHPTIFLMTKSLV